MFLSILKIQVYGSLIYWCCLSCKSREFFLLKYWCWLWRWHAWHRTYFIEVLHSSKISLRHELQIFFSSTNAFVTRWTWLDHIFNQPYYPIEYYTFHFTEVSSTIILGKKKNWNKNTWLYLLEYAGRWYAFGFQVWFKKPFGSFFRGKIML